MQINIKKINNFISLLSLSLLCLVPIFLITGPFLSDLSIVLLGLMYLIYVIINNDYKDFKNKYIFLFFIWNIYLIFLSLTSLDVFLSLESSLFYFRFIIFVLAVNLLLNIYKENLTNIFILILSITIFFVNVDAIIQYFFGTNFLGFKFNGGYRLTGLFDDEEILGSYIIRLLPLLTALFFFNKKYNYNKSFLLNFLILISGFTIMLTGERTALILFIIFYIFYLIVNYNLRIINFLFFIFITPLGLIFILRSENIFYRIYAYTLEQINFNFENINNFSFYIFSKEHHITYQVAINIFKDNYLFGIGPKMFRVVCDFDKYFIENACRTHPHNTYIQLLVETGLIGTLPIIFIFFFVVFFLIKSSFFSVFTRNKTNLSLLFLVFSIFINLLIIAPSGNFFNNWLSVIYYLPIGFLIYELRRK